jgi:PEP-CTERM motif
MKTNLIRIAVVAALASVSAIAQTSTVSATTTGGIPLVTPNGQNDGTINSTFLPLAQWDPSAYPGATLTSVQYRITYSAYGRVNITGVSGATDLDASLTSGQGTAVALSGVGAPVATGNLSVGSIPQLVQNGILAGNLPLTLFTPIYSVTTSYVTDPNTSAYIGTGSVSFDLGATTATGFNARAAGTSDEISISATAGGRSAMKVDVLYTFSSVPEPSTYAAIGFVGLVAGATVWRRRQVAKVA